MIRMIVSDLDGTLIGANGIISPRFFTLLPELRRRGIRFAVATGRQIVSAKTLFEEAGDFINDILFITQNGSCVEEKGNILFRRPLEKVLVKQVLGVVQSKLPQVLPILFTPECGYVSGVAEMEQQALQRAQVYCRQVENLVEIADTLDVVRFTVRDDDGAETISYPVLQQHFGARATVTVATPHWMDIVAREVDKGAVLAAMQSYMGISPEETMVFGDYYNDITMLKQGYYSFAMKDACEEAKRTARFLCGSHVNHGVAETLERFLEMDETEFWRMERWKRTSDALP